MDASFKSFDISFVNKDLKTVQNLTSVCSKKYHDVLLDWAAMLDIILVVTKESIDWPKMMSDIRTNLQAFVDEGCWTPIIEALDPTTVEELSSPERKAGRKQNSNNGSEDNSQRGNLGEIDEEGSDDEFEPESEDSDESIGETDESSEESESDSDSDDSGRKKKKRKAKNTNKDKKIKM